MATNKNYSVQIETINLGNIYLPVSVPGFPRGGANCKSGAANQLFWPIFPKNCMKMEKIGFRGRVPGAPLDPLIIIHILLS